MKIKKITLLPILLSIATTICLSSVAAYAWFSSRKANDANIEAIVHGSYFESGDGSEENKFEIARPIQLYYFNWLQDMGYFNEIQDGTSDLKQYHFYVSEDLDMTGYVLPPAGTKEYPFIGSFDGQGHAFSNLTIDNNSSAYNDLPIENPYESEIIGFFGVVGSLNEDGTVNGKSDEGPAPNHTYNTSVTSVKDFYIDGCTIKTNSENALIGIAAGYVNAPFTGVGVKNSNLYVKNGSKPLQDITKNISDYSIVGYATSSFKDTYETKEIIEGKSHTGEPEPYTADTDGDAWGGSIDMKSTFNRLNSIRSKVTSNNANQKYYDYQQTNIYNSDGSLIEEGEVLRRTVSSAGTPTGNTYAPRLYDEIDTGSFYFWNTNANFIYLYGPNDIEQAFTTIEKTKFTEEKDVFTINESSNYFRITSAGAISSVTNENQATRLFLDSSNHLCFTENEQLYYINFNGTALSTSTTASTIWSKSSSGNNITISCNVSGLTYYLVRFNNTWQMMASNKKYIGDGNGNYIRVTESSSYWTTTASISNTTSLANASAFTFSNSDPNESGYISTTIGNNTYYIRNNNGTLEMTNSTTNRTSWTNEDGTFTNNNYAIAYDNGNWQLSAKSGYKISANGYYLNASSNTAISSGTDSSTATVWQFSNPGTNPSGSISTIYNGSVRYLQTGNNSISLQGTARTFTNSSNKLYYRTNSNNNYIRLNNTTWTGTRTASQGTTLTFEQVKLSINAGTIITPSFSVNSHDFKDTFTYYESEEKTSTSGYKTYFPLSCDADYKVKDSNTGYIVGGGFSDSSSSGRGDIRVSKYSNDDIGNSYKNGNFTNIYTIEGDRTININNSTQTFQKYDDSKEKLRQVLNGDSNVYGLHFMKTSISKNNLITVDKAVVNNTVFSKEENGHGYDLPLDSIDFNLNSKGFVNFFAGTYYSNNKSFFSLHSITRNEHGQITNIREISKIYDTGYESDPYVYEYTDDVDFHVPDPYVDEQGNTHTYKVKFNTSWIKTQSSNLTTDAIYYFEVPLNSGEYCLGSDPGSDGAYLLYLDLAANKQTVYRTTTTQQNYEAINEYEYPLGVAFVENVGDEVNPLKSTGYTLNSSYSNQVGNGTNFIRTDDTITVTPGENIITSYIGEDMTSVTTSPPNIIPLKSTVTLQHQFEQFDENQTTGVVFHNWVYFYDTTVTYNDGSQELTRTIEMHIFVREKGETEEHCVAVLYSDAETFDPETNSVKFNYSYTYNPSSKKANYTLKFNVNTNIYITSLNSDFGLAINGNDVTGTPSEEEPINIQIASYSEDFESLLVTN